MDRDTSIHLAAQVIASDPKRKRRLMVLLAVKRQINTEVRFSGDKVRAFTKALLLRRFTSTSATAVLRHQ
jgi:hypothetical protein